jgi:hypothetical protein
VLLFLIIIVDVWMYDSHHVKDSPDLDRLVEMMPATVNNFR